MRSKRLSKCENSNSTLTNGIVEYEQNKSVKTLGPRDEIEITSRIRINDAETEAVLELMEIKI